MSTNLNIRDAVACIRSQALETAGSVELSARDAPVLTLLGADLVIAYLVEADTHFELVQTRHLAQLEGRRDKLAKFGLRNLMRRASERMEVRTYNNMYAVFVDGHFEASLTLLDSLWDDTLAEMVPNGPVVAMPARDVLGFCDAASTTGIRELRELVDRVWASGPPEHPISRDLFIRREGRWHRFGVSRPDPFL